MTKKNKIILIFACVSCLILLVVGLTLAFVLNYNKLSPDFVIIETSETKVIVKAEANNNYFGYRFKFKDGKTEIFMDSDEPTLDITNSAELNTGFTYYVSACFLGENEGGNSEYSKAVKYQCIEFLAAPILEYVEGNITWNKVENADYYIVNCIGSTLTTHNVYDTKLDISKLPTGSLKISVTAHANDNNCVSSGISNILNIDNIFSFKPFINGTFNENNFELIINGPELLTKIDVKINNTVFQFTQFNVTRIQNTYQYTLDIRAVYNQDAELYVAPSTIDQYNIFSGQFLRIK